jgi:hypothetical protein
MKFRNGLNSDVRGDFDKQLGSITGNCSISEECSLLLFSITTFTKLIEESVIELLLFIYIVIAYI